MFLVKEATTIVATFKGGEWKVEPRLWNLNYLDLFGCPDNKKALVL